ncbi:hypothetical protein GCK72_020563 [Caenorhabditis remanei]|uniref:Uncharacterized protein n=1 Tax=Caenorhabditis remanei TaxID=31234 RepID=A0A6A5GHG6_CAERE|nr:hypothetical protein GCK72_020563 [Caenorhabditis remanei]KAF1754005.1 hypothetical protein GCK72_020563 [Caenorhabditis remanei]
MLASPPRPTIQAFFKEGMKSANIEKRFDIPSASVRTINQQARNKPRYPTTTENSEQPEHSAYRGNSQDARNAQNPETNLERLRSHNNESVSNQQRLVQNYPRFPSESNYQLDSEVNRNIKNAIRQQRPITCELGEGRHPLFACTVNKDVLMRYCAITGRCMESMYTGVYSVTISLLAVQFIYRYWALFSLKQLTYFRGYKSLIWVVYCIFFGGIWWTGAYSLMEMDDAAEKYFEEEMLIQYCVSVKEIPAQTVLAYEPESGLIRWKSALYTLLISSIMAFQ